MKSSCVISFEGLNLNRLFNTLCKRDITVLNIVKRGKLCEIEVPQTRLREVIALLEERCYNVVGIRYKGVSAVSRFVRARFVLPVIILLCVAMTAVLSQFCFRIEVAGDYDNNAVLQALSNAGVRVGGRLYDWNVDKVENSVANELDAMYAVVSREGRVVYVNAVKRKEIDEPVDMTKRRDIVATRDGVVASVMCEQGTPLVKAGDTVKAGDVLIAGHRIFNDGTSRDVYALGRVTIQLTAVGFAEYTGVRTVDQPTGNLFKTTGVVLFGKEYARDCPFERYTTDKSVAYLHPLNLQIVTTVYCETERVTVSATVDECAEELKAQAYEVAKGNCDFAIDEVIYDVNASGAEARLIGKIELR